MKEKESKALEEITKLLQRYHEGVLVDNEVIYKIKEIVSEFPDDTVSVCIKA